MLESPCCPIYYNSMYPQKPSSSFVRYSDLYKDVYDRALLSKSQQFIDVIPSTLPPEPQFIQIKSIGMGAASSVYLVSETHTRTIYAMKLISPNTLLKQKEFLQEEIKIHLSLDHPNVISLYDIHKEEGSLKLVLEYAEMSLMTYLKMKGVLGEGEASRIVAQILQGLQYIHSRGITHRDLKLENILLVHGVVKICDFGLAKRGRVFQSSDLVGTIDYLSPQIVKEKKYTHKTDIWAVGVILWQLMKGSSSFLKSPKETDKYMQLINLRTEQIQYEGISQELREFLGRMLAKQDQRAEAGQLLKERFILKHRGNEYEGITRFV